MSSRQGLKGLDYGVSPAQIRRVVEEAGITEEDSQKLLAKMIEKFPAMAQYADMLDVELGQAGIHALKSWPEHFEAILDGRKTFEIRKDDRGFQVDDVLWLREWDPNTKRHTGRSLEATVTYVTDGKSTGTLTDGHVCMGIRRRT